MHVSLLFREVFKRTISNHNSRSRRNKIDHDYVESFKRDFERI